MKIIFDISLIFSTSQPIVSQIKAPGDKTFLQKRKNLLPRYIDIKINPQERMLMKLHTNNTLPQGYKITELGELPEEWEVVKLGMWWE